jgi:hypothetical protein
MTVDPGRHILLERRNFPPTHNAIRMHASDSPPNSNLNLLSPTDDLVIDNSVHNRCRRSLIHLDTPYDSSPNRFARRHRGQRVVRDRFSLHLFHSLIALQHATAVSLNGVAAFGFYC